MAVEGWDDADFRNDVRNELAPLMPNPAPEVYNLTQEQACPPAVPTVGGFLGSPPLAPSTVITSLPRNPLSKTISCGPVRELAQSGARMRFKPSPCLERKSLWREPDDFKW